MNTELEGLIIAYDAVRQAKSGDEAARLDAIFQARVDDLLARHGGISRDKLIRSIDLAHRRWVLAQQKPSSLPPKA